jgi:hypothetical protein
LEEPNTWRYQRPRDETELVRDASMAAIQNYVHFCCQATLFRRFLRRADPIWLTHVFADMYWVRCVRAMTPSTANFPPSVIGNWMYGWRKVNYSHNCKGTEENDNVAAVKRNTDLYCASRPVALRSCEELLLYFSTSGQNAFPVELIAVAFRRLEECPFPDLQ